MRKYIQNKGITLVSLIITIIILLILAGVGIGVFGGDGMVQKAREAREQAEIDNEKEIVETSVVEAVSANRYGNIEQTELDTYVKKNAKDRPTQVIEDGELIIVEFQDSNRYYQVDDEGNVSQYEIYIDTTPGELAKDENGNYLIESIEDLVAFAAAVRGGYQDENITISAKKFSDETVVLARNLNFKSRFSYNDSQTTKYNGYLGITDETVPLIEALTDTSKYKGFMPIGIQDTSNAKYFNGTFDGNNLRIDNIYQNLEEIAGLFGFVQSGTIKNLTVSGNIKSTATAGGIVGRNGVAVNIENCNNLATVTSADAAAGIISWRRKRSSYKLQ